MEYTQEQLDALIAEKVAEAKQGLYTKEDLQREVTREVDRRVESGIQKGLETKKQKWEEEYAERAKLSAAELAEKELQEQMNALNTTKAEIQKKANRLEAKELLANADIPKSHYEKFIGVLVTDDSETTIANVNNFINMFNETKTSIETNVKSQLTNIPKPQLGDPNVGVTKESFSKMSYSEKMKFKTENPEQFKEFLK